MSEQAECFGMPCDKIIYYGIMRLMIMMLVVVTMTTTAMTLLIMMMLMVVIIMMMIFVHHAALINHQIAISSVGEFCISICSNVH